MLAYILALAVALGSLALYLAGFFFSEIHRKSDFYWSGAGLFYALVLWAYAGQIKGGLLLGQIASVALLGWFAWQTFTLRRQLVPAGQQTAIPSTAELKQKLSNIPIPSNLTQLPAKLPELIGRLKETAGKFAQRPAKTDAPKQPSINQALKEEIIDAEAADAKPESKKPEPVTSETAAAPVAPEIVPTPPAPKPDAEAVPPSQAPTLIADVEVAPVDAPKPSEPAAAEELAPPSDPKAS